MIDPKQKLKEIGLSNENIYQAIEKAFEDLINEAIENIGDAKKELEKASDFFSIIESILAIKELSGILISSEINEGVMDIEIAYEFLYEPTREYLILQIAEALNYLIEQTDFSNNNIDQEDIYNHAITLLRDYETYMGKDFFLILYEELRRTKPDFFDIEVVYAGNIKLSDTISFNIDFNIKDFVNKKIREENIKVARIYNAGKMLYAKNTPFYTVEFYLENEGVTKKLIQIKEWAYYDSFDIYNSIIKKLRKLDKALLQKIKDYIGTNRAVFKFDSFGAFTHSTYSFIVTFKRIY